MIPEIGTQKPSIKDSTPIVCDECGNDKFTEVVLLRRLSKLLIGSQKDLIVPINVFACSKCGHINKEFIPEGLEDKGNGGFTEFTELQ